MQDQQFTLIYDAIKDIKEEQKENRKEMIRNFERVDKRFSEVNEDIKQLRIEVHDIRKDTKKLNNMKITWSIPVATLIVLISVVLSVITVEALSI